MQREADRGEPVLCVHLEQAGCDVDGLGNRSEDNILVGTKSRKRCFKTTRLIDQPTLTSFDIRRQTEHAMRFTPVDLGC